MTGCTPFCAYAGQAKLAAAPTKKAIKYRRFISILHPSCGAFAPLKGRVSGVQRLMWINRHNSHGAGDLRTRWEHTGVVRTATACNCEVGGVLSQDERNGLTCTF